jgi:MFS family permease
MIAKFLHRLLEPRHYWRNVGFDELSELYVSQLLRSLGVSLIGLFTPIYLYKLGYSLVSIAAFFIAWFALRPLLDYVNGFIVAKIGPKHSMLMSSFLHVVYLGLLITLKNMHWPLALIAVVGSNALGLYLISMYVDFSKVKHSEHGGKELGYLSIVERIGGILGPLVGGLIATFYDPRYTVGLAMIILIFSTIPLFFSSEAVQTNQHITFRGLDIKGHKMDYLSVIPYTIENVISVIVWPLYAAVFLLGDNTFAKLGAIATLSTLSCIVLSRYIGSVIDNRKGRKLLEFGVIINTFTHLVRPFISSVLGVLAINVINEPVTASYRMPYMKGFYDASDSQPGFRIAYLASINIVDSLARLSFWIVVWVLMHFINSKTVLIGTFFAAALFSLGILSERFEALRARRSWL